MPESTATLWLQVLIFLGVVANIAYAWLKRKWEIQDLDRRAKDARRAAEVEAEKVKDALVVHNTQLEAELKLLAAETRHREEMAMQRGETAAAQRAMLVLELQKNTALTKDAAQQAKQAYVESNSLNEKIAETNLRAVAERQQDQQTAEHIKETTDNLHSLATQYMVQQAPGGERALPTEEPAAPTGLKAQATPGKAEPLRGPYQDQPT